jgi:hypothetical protein
VPGSETEAQDDKSRRSRALPSRHCRQQGPRRVRQLRELEDTMRGSHCPGGEPHCSRQQKAGSCARTPRRSCSRARPDGREDGGE